MPSFSDSIFLFVLALLLFGPKRLPVLARELGKWVGEFRRASNEFKMQMEEELRLSEQADRQKQIAAIEAAAPLPAPIEEPEHPHLPPSEPAAMDAAAESTESAEFTESAESIAPATDADAADLRPISAPAQTLPATIDAVPVLPIATSGELRMMPPSTGLPTPRHPSSRTDSNPLGGLLDSIPETHAIPESRNILEGEARETAAHGH